MITTADAALRLGVHQTRVQVLIRGGRLPALMLGGTYLINERDLKLVAIRKPGRPPKQAPAAASATTKPKRKTPTKA